MSEQDELPPDLQAGIGREFEAGRILDALEPGTYFKRNLAETYIDRETVKPNRLGMRLLRSDYALLLPAEKMLLRETVRFLRDYHKCGPADFGRLFDLTAKRAQSLYLLANSDRILNEVEAAASGVDETAIEAARNAGVAVLVESMYLLGARAAKRVEEMLPAAEIGEATAVMKAAFNVAGTLSKRIGQPGAGGDDRSKDNEALKARLKDLLKLVSATEAHVEEVPQ